MGLNRLCCTKLVIPEVLLSRTDSSHGLCDRDAKGCVAVHDGDADLDFRDLSVKVPRHEALPQKFHTVHPLPGRVMHRMIPRGLVSTRLRRWYPLQSRQIARPRYFEARRALFLATALAVTVFHGLAFLRGGMTASEPRSAIASWHLRVS